MIMIAVVDDDYQVIAQFTKILGRYYGAGKYLQQDFTNGAEFVESLDEGLPNIVFMDIEMKMMGGREAVQKLRERDINESVFVIYVSSHTEHLVPLFPLHPFDFLEKPVTDKAVISILDKIGERMNAENRTCKLIVDRKEINVNVNDVAWVQSQGHRLEIKTCTGAMPYYCYGKLDDLLRTLNDACDDFLRIHASYVVNRRYITKFTQKEVYVEDRAFPISVKFRNEIIMKLHERL